MQNRLERVLFEMFGDPIDPIYGTKTGDVKGISTVGAVGARDIQSEDVMVCPRCREMPINGSCACDHSDGSDDGTVCPGCGMMVIAGECGCTHNVDVCPKCQMMPAQINSSSCGCGLNETVEGMCGECGMNESMCQCGMYEEENKGPSKSTLKKIFKGDKTFKDKVDTVKSWQGIDDPKAFAAWATNKMTGKWPSED